MMTHKLNQGSIRSSNKNNEEIQETSQVYKRNYPIKKRNGKYKTQRFESTTQCHIARSHDLEVVARVMGTPLVPVVPTVIPVTTVSTFYPQYSEPLGYPVTMHDWNVMSAVQVHSPVYSVPYPMPMAIYNPTPILASPVCSYTATMISPPVIPLIPQPPSVYIEEIPMIANCVCDHVHQFSPQQIVPERDTFSESPIEEESISSDSVIYDTLSEESSTPKDPIECYLNLPKDMFPRATMLALDPNPMIDQLCKAINLHSNLSWMLDLEFGIPKAPITRPIPIYDVKFNSIHCKNAIDAVHPGFESCSEEFKKVLMFYYDCIISAWYRGFVAMCGDISVEHFQEWLLVPMQVLGMCWP